MRHERQPKERSRTRLRHPIVRYGFGVAAVAMAFVLRTLLEPITGTGAPFVLFFGAVLATSLYAGVGPGLTAALLSVPLGAYTFVVRAGYAPAQAEWQAALFVFDCSVAVYLSSLMRRVGRATEEAQARIHDLVELAPDAFFLADLDARFVEVNQAACRLLGYERQELIGKTIFDFIPPDDAARLVAVRAELMAPGSVNRGEWRQKRKDGTFVPVEVSTNILGEGRWQAFVRDISQRKRVEDERQVFVSLVENSPDFIGIADPEGKPIYLNPAGRRMVGLPAECAIQETRIPEYYPPEQRAFASDVIVCSMIERGHWSGETYFRNWQSGEAIPVSDTHFMIRDSTGTRVLGMGTITRDISEARRVAREREELLARERAARQLTEETNRHLRESEERFRLTIDEAPIGMALVALDGRFVRVNAALCQIVGYDAEQLRRLTFQDITHPDDLAWDVALAKRLESGEIPRCQFEKRYIRKDGAIVTVMLNVSILRAGDGSPLYYITQIEDITERKRMDDALRLSEARFSGIVSISADAIICIDEAQRITLFNDGAERIFGYGRCDVLGAPVHLLVPERLRAAHREHIARFAAGQVAARGMGERLATIVGRRKNGAEFPAEAAISKLKIDSEVVLTVALRDVTAQRRAEREQRLLAEAGAVLSSSLDYEQALASLARLLARDFADACILELFEDRERTLRLIVASADPSKASLAAEVEPIRVDRNRPHLARQVLETGQPFVSKRLTPEEAESLGQSAEHQRLLQALDAHSVMALPLQIRGRLLGALVFVSSTPSRVFDDGDLRLAGAIADRAALAVENGRLYWAAIEATRLRDQVLGVVAHDLRNPLSVIRMQAAALGRKEPEPERRTQKPRERIFRAADRIDHLIQDLLDVTVIEARELGLERERLSPRRLLLDTIEAQGPLASAASLDLRLEARPDLPDVWGDVQRLSQVLENLIGNAIKFTPTGGRITVRAAPSQRDVVFSVADTGCGIAQEGLSHVFDRFWQMRKTAGAGAGLGLPIARGIVEAHGGRIWVESTVGRGTIFFFAIPQAPPAQPEVATGSGARPA